MQASQPARFTPGKCRLDSLHHDNAAVAPRAAGSRPGDTARMSTYRSLSAVRSAGTSPAVVTP
ncbi:MAG TPA: hypothetical protein VF796_19750 [Humisphaera sp.]